MPFVLALSVLLAQGSAPKPWIWTEERATPAPVPEPPPAGFGHRVVVLDDIDGDHVPDLAISSPQDGSRGSVEHGRIDIVSGVDGRPLASCFGDTTKQRLGSRLVGAPDVDRDGFADLIAGTANGDSRVISSRTGRVLEELPSRNVVVASDLDGDGVPDFLAMTTSDAGVGGDGSRDLLTAISGCDDHELYQIVGEPRVRATALRLGWFRNPLCMLGDLDGDGTLDFCVGIPDLRDCRSPVGAVRFFSGRTGTTLRTVKGSLGPGGYTLGVGLARAGDIDQDGVEDVLSSTGDDGPVIVISGRTGEVLRTLRTRRSGGYLEGFAETMACAGDIDRDGVPDLAIGSSEYPMDEQDDYSVQLFSGKDGHLIADLDADRLDATVAEGRDFDGDGIPDLPVGLPGADEVVILSGAGLSRLAPGSEVARSDWPELQVVRPRRGLPSGCRPR